MAPSPFRLFHRGFDLGIRTSPTPQSPPTFGFVLAQDGHQLHASRPVFRTVASAERAARRFVDDALATYTAALELQASL